MPEHHEIIGPAQGEPLPQDRVGARVRLPLDSAPTTRWTDVMCAHLAAALVGHPAVGHLRLNGCVQGAAIVLEGVEPAEAERLGPALSEAVAAANAACASDPEQAGPRNMDQPEADRVAQVVTETTSAR